MRIWVISKSKECEARVWFETTSMIARNEVLTPLYYIQFEIAKFSSSETVLFSLWKCFFYLAVSWSSEICKTEWFFNFIGWEKDAIERKKVLFVNKSHLEIVHMLMLDVQSIWCRLHWKIEERRLKFVPGFIFILDDSTKDSFLIVNTPRLKN